MAAALIPVDAVGRGVGAGDGFGHAAGDRSAGCVGGGSLGLFTGDPGRLGAVGSPVEGDAHFATVPLKIQGRIDDGSEDREQKQNRDDSGF